MRWASANVGAREPTVVRARRSCAWPSCRIEEALGGSLHRGRWAGHLPRRARTYAARRSGARGERSIYLDQLRCCDMAEQHVLAL